MTEQNNPQMDDVHVGQRSDASDPGDNSDEDSDDRASDPDESTGNSRKDSSEVAGL